MLQPTVRRGTTRRIALGRGREKVSKRYSRAEEGRIYMELTSRGEGALCWLAAGASAPLPQ